MIGWVALLLAALGAAGVLVAGMFALDGARNPQSFGDLGAVVTLMFALIPSMVALVVAYIQGRGRWVPRWQTWTTVVLAALAPVTHLVLLTSNLVA